MHCSLETSSIRIPNLCHNQMTCESGASASFLCDGSFSSEVKTTRLSWNPLGDRKQRRRYCQEQLEKPRPRLKASVSAKWVGGRKAFFVCPDSIGLWPCKKIRRCSTFSRREGLFPPYPEPTKAEIKLFTTCAREGPVSPELVQEAAGDVRIVATRLCEASVHGLELKMCTSTTRPSSQQKVYHKQLSFGADDRIDNSALSLFLFFNHSNSRTDRSLRAARIDTISSRGNLSRQRPCAMKSVLSVVLFQLWQLHRQKRKQKS